MTPSTSFVDCDVVIVNYNAGAFLSDCIRSVIAEQAKRVIVVDNASSDGSIEALERADTAAFSSVTVIQNGQNLGFAKACNIGIEASSGSRILFLNPDCVLCPGALSQMIEALERSPRIGMVGGFLSNPDGSEQPGGRRVFPTPKRAFLRAFGLTCITKFLPDTFSDFLLHKDALPNDPVIVEAISGACMLVRRDAIEDVGLWDGDYFLHCEDLDWCMRFRQKQWIVMFVPQARVVHAWGACSRSRPIFVEWHKHRGMLLFYRKFFRHQYPGVVWTLVTVGVWIRFVLVASYYSVRDLLTQMGIVRD